MRVQTAGKVPNRDVAIWLFSAKKKMGLSFLFQSYKESHLGYCSNLIYLSSNDIFVTAQKRGNSPTP